MEVRDIKNGQLGRFGRLTQIGSGHIMTGQCAGSGFFLNSFI
jgi:hypothetical protein